jgi:N-6 DNA Methylase
MPKDNIRKHEVAFCAEVSKWSDRLFESDTSLPFGSSDIESFGTGSRKRQDIRIYERKAKGRGRIALCGEVKLPGSRQGRSPFDPALMTDAFQKANNENCRYFFTWNVEHLALFDRSLWDRETMHERCVGQWSLGMELNDPSQLTRAEVESKIRDEFLPNFFREFAEIWLGRKKDLGQKPWDFYVAVIESNLSGPKGPVRELRDYLSLEADRNKTFDGRLRTWMIEQQWNFDRHDPNGWRQVVDRAARSMVYVLSNRILFYQAVRLRNSLPELRIPSRAKTPDKALEYLRSRFEEAVEVTGDYEPVFFPDDKEWAAEQALSGGSSIEAWDKFIQAVDRFAFKEIGTDILGHVFQKLISQDERQKFGQFYTEQDIVDVINAFCIRHAEANILDPACGSGSFLVRAYYRKACLDASMVNQDLLEGIYGCDINPFPAHLATLNLAARNITNEENYPRVVRKNFFTVRPNKTFCELPKATRTSDGERETERLELPTLDAVVGNPPYVRHEHIPKASERGVIRDQTKEYIYEAVERAWPGVELSRQSDLHVYFWPVAAQFLADDGWFGFLTSSSWLDVRYGFALQRWVLLHFKVVAIIESIDEPWFEDARVKTAATILQRCEDEGKRNDNLVRFVRLKRALAEILGERDDERQRQEAAERLRDRIVKTRSDFSNDSLRIMVKRQEDLWQEGLSVAQMFARQKALASGALDTEDDDLDSEETEAHASLRDEVFTSDYGGGKWGRYLRAPNFYFEIMRELGHRFTRLGEVAAITFGIKSGCDGFFMPRDVSKELLMEYQSETEWRDSPLMRRCKRAEVENGDVIVVKCSDHTLHPIESRFVRPEVHSLMQVDRPIVSPGQLDRVVLWVNQPLDKIKDTYAHRYITWGSKQTFASKKSKSVPIPARATVKGRPLWYDLTGLEPGLGFWPKSQQYRHIIPANPYSLNCNCNLYDIHGVSGDETATRAIIPILNSTLVAFLKPFYGRYAGTEGNLKTEVVDALLLEIPDPRKVSGPVLARLERALALMQGREVTHLVEEEFLRCHTAGEVRKAAQLPLGLARELQQEDRRGLDDAVFELLGVADSQRRSDLIDRLYREVAQHFRSIRIVEVQKMEQRRHGSGRDRVSQLELALDAWGELDPEWRMPLAVWIAEHSRKSKTVELPDGEVRLPEAGNFFEATTLYFGKKPALSHVCASRAEAELLYKVANVGLRGSISIPENERGCEELSRLLSKRLSEGSAKLQKLAEERAGTDRLREQVIDQLNRWFIQGKLPE